VFIATQLNSTVWLLRMRQRLYRGNDAWGHAAIGCRPDAACSARSVGAN